MKEVARKLHKAYRQELTRFVLEKNRDEGLKKALELGQEAQMYGMSARELATLHEECMLKLILGSKFQGQARKRWKTGRQFMLHAIIPLETANFKLSLSNVELRKAAEKLKGQVAEHGQALTQQKGYFRLLFAGNPLPMWVFDPETLRFLEVNEAAIRDYGYSREEFLHMKVTDIRPPEDRPAFLEQRKRAPPGLHVAGEWRHRLKSGRIIDVEVAAQEIALLGRRAVLVVIHDVSRRKEAEEGLRQANARLQGALSELEAAERLVIQQERLRALGTMASGIAHDFNNALSPILGFTELMLATPENLANKEKVLHALRTINTAAKDAAGVVKRLKEFYRTRAADDVFELVDLHELVDQVVMLTRPRWKDQLLTQNINIRVVNALNPKGGLAIHGSQPELREALTNLIFNAVDAMPEGGTITIRARTDQERVMLEVEDMGTGMTEEVRQRCLEPFFSTKGEHGTGLGLSMVFGIIRRHQGSIEIESSPGEGTTFSLSFPAMTTVSAEAKEGTNMGGSGRFLRVLLVDDEPLIREIITEYLQGDGHRVETAKNGQEAAEKFDPGFDLVITDQAMPEMSGDRLAHLIKKMAPSKPVILLTGTGDLLEQKPPDVDIVVAKPVTLSALREAITAVFAFPTNETTNSNADSP